METQSLHTSKYGENDGASKNVLAPAISNPVEYLHQGRGSCKTRRSC